MAQLWSWQGYSQIALGVFLAALPKIQVATEPYCWAFMARHWKRERARCTWRLLGASVPPKKQAERLLERVRAGEVVSQRSQAPPDRIRALAGRLLKALEAAPT